MNKNNTNKKLVKRIKGFKDGKLWVDKNGTVWTILKPIR
jgi:hypothetical protein